MANGGGRIMRHLINLKLFLIIFWNLIQPLPLFAAPSTTIVFSNDGHTNPYHVEWLSAFEDALKAYNKEFGNIEGYWVSASRIEEQYEQVSAEIEKGVDILFVNAMSIEAMTPLVKKAQKKGITWVSVHNNIASADYNFILGDFENGYNQGMALATYFKGEAKIALMLGMRANTSGDARQAGILAAVKQFPNIEVLAQEPADWSTSKALMIAEKWYSKYPDLDALSVVTDTYLYPAMEVAKDNGLEDLSFFGYDGDKKILTEMKGEGRVKADILLSATREGWNFVQLAYKIANNIPVEKDHLFYTPLVLSDKTYEVCRENGFPDTIEVININRAIELSDNAFQEFGPNSVKTSKR